jgi:hypothetical protein
MYKAELYSDKGQNHQPPETLVKVRFQPPVEITTYMQETNGFTGLELTRVGTTQRASVYDIWISGVGEGGSVIAHEERIRQAAMFVADVLAEVNAIDDLEDGAWAQHLEPVEFNQKG